MIVSALPASSSALTLAPVDPLLASAHTTGIAAGDGTARVAVSFEASGSHDPDGTIVSYRFVFGDRTEVVTDSPIVSHRYAASHPVRLAWAVEVTDDAGLRDAVVGSVRVTP